MGSLPFDARDVLNNTPGLGEVFRVIKLIEDQMLHQGIKELDHLVSLLDDAVTESEYRGNTYKTEGQFSGRKIANISLVNILNEQGP